MAARPAGLAQARASLELGLALGANGGGQEQVRSLRAAAAAASPQTRGAVLAALGASLAAAGDQAGAVEALRTAVAEGTPAVSERARWRAADALHAQGLARDAVAAWRSLAGDPLATNLPPAARLAYAADLRAVGERKRAIEVLRALWSQLPERDESCTAEAKLVEWRDAGDDVAPFTPDERLARAHRLVAMGRSWAAREELAAVEGTVPAPPPALLSLAKATVLLALGRTADAAREVSRYADDPDPGTRRGVSMILARAAARERRFPDAIAAWRAVAAGHGEVPGLPPSAQASLRDDAEFFAAWLQLEDGDLAAAGAALDRLARERPRSRRADDARWFAAWALVRQGAAVEADAALQRLERGPLERRARYWRARVAPTPERRDELLRELVAADPLGYYGLLACARLRAAKGTCVGPALDPGPDAPDLEALPDAARLRQAAALAAAGLRDDAVLELAAIARPRNGRRSAPAAAELAAFLGDPLLPFRVARDQVGLTRRSLAWSFPDAWPSLVAPAARSAGVDPALLRAVMRRESGFRSEARSSAGAVGLLQIVPGTSARLGALLQLPEPVAQQTEDPAVNVVLGATYLSLLLERFGEPFLAIAAYNAGPNAVLRWNGERAGMPLDVWVESIPFRETRDYVRAVVENWAGARTAIGEPLPPLDPDRTVKAPAIGIAF